MFYYKVELIWFKRMPLGSVIYNIQVLAIY